MGTTKNRRTCEIFVWGEENFRCVLDLFLMYSEDRVRRGCEKLARAVGQKQQGRLDGFFTCVFDN